MEKHSVRITHICIHNFKNIMHGELTLDNAGKDYNASVLGLYGQNGSGKTALIDALALLKYVLCGQQIPEKYAEYISVEAQCSRFVFGFRITDDLGFYNVWYEFSLGKAFDNMLDNMDDNELHGTIKVEIYDEVLSFSYESDNTRIRKSILIDTHTDGESAFVPLKKYEELLGDISRTDISVIKRYVRATSRSFIFSGEMITRFRNKCKNERYMSIIQGLVVYGNRELFVINTENIGLISLNALPIFFKYSANNAEAFGNLMLTLNAPTSIPEEAQVLVLKLIDSMNIVLDKIVPGLTIGIQIAGESISKEGKLQKTIQVMSRRDGKEIPFQYESEGIKKIVSILQLLIVIYNNPSVTVAVDELDAGVFEYLLGEILRIISEKGKGQLVFTSHNLRPLETLYKGFIAFTTTNPENRYIRMTNVKKNNNLRDFYYRDIILGEQSEQVYDPTNNYEIALALREAGDLIGA